MMINRFLLLSAAAASWMVVAGPVTTPVTAQVPRTNAGVMLTAADTNRIIAVRVGRVVTVTLRQAAGTGSSWRMVPAAGLIQVGPPDVIAASGPPMAGGPEMHRFRVRITAPGELALTFVDARTFGGPDQPAETATFVIEAQ